MYLAWMLPCHLVMPLLFVDALAAAHSLGSYLNWLCCVALPACHEVQRSLLQKNALGGGPD
eukprot:2188547-Amphidinium_carterae.1